MAALLAQRAEMEIACAELTPQGANQIAQKGAKGQTPPQTGARSGLARSCTNASSANCNLAASITRNVMLPTFTDRYVPHFVLVPSTLWSAQSICGLQVRVFLTLPANLTLLTPCAFLACCLCRALVCYTCVPQERPYVCDICGHPFHQKPNLDRHRATVHQEVRPFRCEECGLTFARRSILRTHSQTAHERSRRYECTVCHTRFSLNRELASHMRASHPGHGQTRSGSSSRDQGR